MNETIEHMGNVVRTENEKVIVSIYSKSVCSKCDVRGSCNSLSGTSEKIFEINVKKNHNFILGQKVRLSISTRTGNKGVLIAYIMPLILLISGMIVSDSLFHKDGITAITAIIILFLYFGILSLFKNKLHKTFEINVEPYDDTINLIAY